MVSVLDCGMSSPGRSPGGRNCVVFLGNTPLCHSISFRPGVEMGTGKFNAGDNPATD